jgi:hypothetical protein
MVSDRRPIRLIDDNRLGVVMCQNVPARRGPSNDLVGVRFG